MPQGMPISTKAALNDMVLKTSGGVSGEQDAQSFEEALHAVKFKPRKAEVDDLQPYHEAAESGTFDMRGAVGQAFYKAHPNDEL